MQRSLITILFALSLAAQAQVREEINVGTPGSGTGDPLRTAFIKVNTNLFHVWNTFTNAALLHIGGIDPILQSGYVLGQGSNTVLRLDGSTVYVDALADVFTPTGDLDMASNNIVGVGVLEAADIDVPTLTSALGSLQDDIDTKMPGGAYTNANAFGVYALHVLRAPKYASLTITNNSVTINREDAVDWYIKADDDLTIYDPAPPTDGETIELEIENVGAGEIGLSWGDWIFRTQVVPALLGADEKLWVVAKATPAGVYASYEYRQDQQLGTVRGGTGTVRGEAVAPISTVYYPPLTSVTNFSADLAYGRFARVFMDEEDLYLSGISGRPASTNEMRWQEIEVWNVGATTNTIRVRPDVFTKGVPTNGITLEPNQRELLRVMAYSADYTNNWVFGSAGSQLVGGGGDPPSNPSTLTNGLLAFLEFEDASSATASDSVGSYDFTPNNSALFAAEQTGKHTYSFTNAASGTMGYLSRAHTDLRTPSDGTRTWAGWVHFGAAIGNYEVPFGQWGTSGNRAWFLYTFSNTLRIRHSITGSGTGDSAWDSGLTVSAATWHYVVCVIDNANKTLKVSLDGGTYESTSIASVVDTVNSAVTLYGYGTSGTLGGKMDSVGVWDRALTQGEVELLYNEGNGLSYADMD